MRRLGATLALLLAALGLLLAWGRPLPRARSGSTPPAPPAASLLAAGYRSGIDSLAAAVRALGDLPPGATGADRQAAFRRARECYKRVEYLLTDLLPDAEISLNGPPLPRPDETTAGVEWPPSGLQVIESALFPTVRPGAAGLIAGQVRLMAPTLAALRHVRFPAAADTRFFDAVRRELARVSALGLAGYDATVSGDGLVESAEALRGTRAGLTAYRPPLDHPARPDWDELDRRMASAIAALAQAPSFDRFDRLRFIAGFANPAAVALSGLQRQLGIPRAGAPGAWTMTASTLFETGALDPLSYAPSDATALPSGVASLGRSLFFDLRLSRGSRRSCATCHQPGQAFADGLPRARVVPGPGHVRNTPTLLNAALQPVQFADARARALEDQAAAVLANPREMHLPVDSAAAFLRADQALAARFAAVYGGSPSAAITPRRIQLALAAFVRSLVALDSRFDRAVRGDSTVLTSQERVGFTVFMGKGACATCHFLPTFGGSLPPHLLESEPEVIGVPSRAVRRCALVDPDPGVAGFDHAEIHRHAFKTPSLRNVALTSPYMHNGVYRTLEQVVDFYDRGGGAGIGIALPNQTLSDRPLHLSRDEGRALIAFLRTLTDSSLVSR